MPSIFAVRLNGCSVSFNLNQDLSSTTSFDGFLLYSSLFGGSQTSLIMLRERRQCSGEWLANLPDLERVS